MDSIETAFAALSQKMSSLAMPVRAPGKHPEPIGSLLARVDAMKRGYEPGARR